MFLFLVAARLETMQKYNTTDHYRTSDLVKSKTNYRPKMTHTVTEPGSHNRFPTGPYHPSRDQLETGKVVHLVSPSTGGITDAFSSVENEGYETVGRPHLYLLCTLL